MSNRPTGAKVPDSNSTISCFCRCFVPKGKYLCTQKMKQWKCSTPNVLSLFI